MTAPAFDGTAYRKDVLAPLREGNPAEVEDLFWLANVPRDVDDDAQVAARLRAARGFLNKELSRARQAAVASAVLKEWPRVERGLGDAAGRRALRERLERGGAAAAPKAAPRRRAAGRSTDPAARRRRQVAANLQELARLRDEPELAEDLFAFLGLPTTAGRSTIEERLAKVGEVNRRRRADRERTLTDELLAHARELLVVGDPAAYLEGFGKDAAEAVVDALLSGDGAAARAALDDARAAGVADATILVAVAGPAKARVADAPARGAGTVPVSATGLGVWCPACGTVGPPHAVRCAGCDGALTVICASCRTQSPADLATCPSCSASLDEVRAPLVARRAERAQEDAALAAVDAAPAAERPARLAALAAAHPGWVGVRRRLDALPPAAPAQVLVSYSSGEARLEWPVSEEPGVDAYLVERVDGAARRVLGRTGTTTWTDRAAPGDAAGWEVRALRGEVASAPTRAISAVMARSRPPKAARRATGPAAPPAAASGGPGSPSGTGASSTVPSGAGAASTPPSVAGAASSSSPRASAPPAAPSPGTAPRAARGLRDLPPPAAAPAGLHDVQAQPGPPVRVSWRAPAGSTVLLVRTERRPEGDVRRHLTVDPGVYVDRHVGRGRTYEYEVRLAGDPGDPQVVRVEAGSRGIVRATTGGASPGTRSAAATEAAAVSEGAAATEGAAASQPAAASEAAAASQPAAGPVAPPEPARSSPPAAPPTSSAPAAATPSPPSSPSPESAPAGAGATVASPSPAPGPSAVPPPPPAPIPTPAAPPSDGMGPIRVQRDGEGRLVARWSWPVGVTEAFVAWGTTPPEGATETGRKVTNMRYELDDGAVLSDVPPGAHVAVMAGRREASGVLVWGAVDDRSRAVAP